MEENQVNIPEGWQEYRIIEVCDILDNMRRPLNKTQRESMRGEIPYYGANNIQDYINDFIFNEPLILIAEDGGNFAEYETRPIAQNIDGKSWVNNHTHVLRVKPSYSHDYIFYNVVNKDILGFIKGGTRAKLNKKELEEISLILPKSKTEQTQIATVLSKVDDAIDKTQKLIVKYARIKTGLMQDLLTKGIDEQGNIRSEETHEFKDSPLGRIPMEWECAFIEELADLKSGGTPSRQNSFFWGGSISWVKTGEVDYNIIYSIEEFITDRGLKFSSATLFPANTILMALYGQGKTRGRVAILGTEATTNQACLGFLNLRRVTTNFLYISLSFEYEKLRDLSNDGAQKNLSGNLLKKYLLKIPSDMKEQKKIDEIFEKIDLSITKQKSQLSKLQSLKTGLMQDLLSGKVRVNC